MGTRYLDGLGTTWETMYSQEPCTGISDELCNTLMMGGGGEQWGETVDTSDLEQTIWPRLGAIGERLWSPRNISDPDAASARYSAFRCLYAHLQFPCPLALSLPNTFRTARMELLSG
jgi:hexosaminidase